MQRAGQTLFLAQLLAQPVVGVVFQPLHQPQQAVLVVVAVRITLLEVKTEPPGILLLLHRLKATTVEMDLVVIVVQMISLAVGVVVHPPLGLLQQQVLVEMVAQEPHLQLVAHP